MLASCQAKKENGLEVLGVSFDNEKDPKYIIYYEKESNLESNDTSRSSARKNLLAATYDQEKFCSKERYSII